MPLRPTFLFWCLILLGAMAPVVHAAKFSRVVIDAGHGAQDNGARIGYIYEKHLALDVARRLERYLNNQGIRTTMTRTGDDFLALEKRSAIANGLRDSIFVSIHFNMVSYAGPKGVETFYYTQEGYNMAAYIQQSIVGRLRTVNRGVKFGRYKVLRTCTRPAVLVEGGFISTQADLKRCLDPKYREGLAESIALGLLRYRKS
jgi:N-acetylmuramoyl-L-alanine amidase